MTQLRKLTSSLNFGRKFSRRNSSNFLNLSPPPRRSLKTYSRFVVSGLVVFGVNASKKFVRPRRRFWAPNLEIITRILCKTCGIIAFVRLSAFGGQHSYLHSESLNFRPLVRFQRRIDLSIPSKNEIIPRDRRTLNYLIIISLLRGLRRVENIIRFKISTFTYFTARRSFVNDNW